MDIGVSVFAMLPWVLWHRGYPDRGPREPLIARSRIAVSWDTPRPFPQAFWLAGVAAVFARDVATVHACSNDFVAHAREHYFA